PLAVDAGDHDLGHVADVGVALAPDLPRHQRLAHAVEEQEPAGTGAEEGGRRVGHAGDVGAGATAPLPQLGPEVPPRPVAHGVAVDGDVLAVELDRAGHVAELVEVPRFVGLVTRPGVRLRTDSHPGR